MAAVSFSGLFLASVALINFIFVFGTCVEFVKFISFRAIYYNITGRAPQVQESSSRGWSVALQDPAVLRPLAVDLALLFLFAVQHSLLAVESVKRRLRAVFGVLQRGFYVFTTALALQVLIRYWQPVRDAPFLWNSSTAPWSTWLPLLCFIIHFLCWLIIFSIVLIFDYAELMGIKQVYYHCLGLGDPLSMKSPRAQRLYAHLRHPVYLEVCVVLWAVPCLSLDRLLLSGVLSLYLTCGHSLDTRDYTYLSAQLHNKLDLFSRSAQPGSNGQPVSATTASCKDE
ncbi:nurim-like [Acipenser ruthenus]|uniref:nurim-like n=1 Tax=Acipenser ruthenus TaxID=7906 RepID=UPI00145B86A4|nr:nurim-like [Acipenser ruthenus]